MTEIKINPNTMILELATIRIKEGTNEHFEWALKDAAKVISQSPGFLGMEVKKCIEQPDRYVLLISWNSLEAHTQGFRNSPLFAEWRRLIGPYFEEMPQVLHYE
jgi:heme-degrading monooxygenase HmoA